MVAELHIVQGQTEPKFFQLITGPVGEAGVVMARLPLLQVLGGPEGRETHPVAEPIGTVPIRMIIPDIQARAGAVQAGAGVVVEVPMEVPPLQQQGVSEEQEAMVAATYT